MVRHGVAAPAQLIQARGWAANVFLARTGQPASHFTRTRIDLPGLGHGILGQKAHLTFMRHLCSFYILLWPEFHILAISRQLIYNVNGAESQQLLHE